MKVSGPILLTGNQGSESSRGKQGQAFGVGWAG